MKTRTEEYTTAPSTYTQTYYGCDHCGFESRSERAVKNHAAHNHSFAEKREVDGTLFLRFEDEASFGAYKECDDAGCHRDPIRGDWKGPGWYGETYESGPCGRGCCSREWYQLRPARDFLRDWESQVAEFQGKIETLAGGLGISLQEEIP